MRTITTALKAEADKLNNDGSWITLLDIHLDDDNLLLLTDNNEDVTFDGKTYQAFDIGVSELETNSDGSLKPLHLFVSSVSREVTAYIMNNKIRGRTVYVRVVNTNALGSADNQLFEKFTARSIKIVDATNIIQIELGNPPLFNKAFPGNRFTRSTCTRFAFGGSLCGFVVDNNTPSNLTECDRTFDGPAGCRAHGDYEQESGLTREHPRRFGGWLGLPKGWS